MDYTQSPQNVTHGSTGQRMHSDSAVPTTRVTDKDMNALAWEIMEMIKWGVANGVMASALPFDPSSPPTYTQLRQSIFGAITQQITLSGSLNAAQVQALINSAGLLKRDGSTPMTAALTLFGDATLAQHAPNLAQVQTLVAGSSGPVRTWQDVTLARALNVTYTNSSAHDRAVAVSYGGFNSNLFVSINGVNNSYNSTAGAGTYPSIYFEVPPGATYLLSGSAGNLLWSELA